MIARHHLFGYVDLQKEIAKKPEKIFEECILDQVNRKRGICRPKWFEPNKRAVKGTEKVQQPQSADLFAELLEIKTVLPRIALRRETRLTVASSRSLRIAANGKLEFVESMGKHFNLNKRFLKNYCPCEGLNLPDKRVANSRSEGAVTSELLETAGSLGV